ncbi:MAG TPA: GerMN domain-containing protein [Leptolyngbyaceae cyanobacterium]
MFVIRQSALIYSLITILGLSAGGKLVANAHQPKSTSQATIDRVKVSQNRVKVFFPNYSRNNTDLGHVEPVWRTTQRRDIARFAIEQLIAGPTRNEIKNGFMKPIQFRGSSNCGGDFNLSLSGGVARLKFCRTIPSAGIGDDARVKSSVDATLQQFSTVNSVIVLTKEGDCYGDMSGENFCLQRR